jgi:hypothetical protein
MKYQISTDDLEFQRQFETGSFPPAEFSHREHVRLAYVYLCGNEPEAAHFKMRQALQQYLAHHGIDPGKYHETMTKAWVLAVRHFMERSAGAASSEQFIENCPLLLEKEIMLTHYTKSELFSEKARSGFIEPDLEQIPRYA